MHATTQPSTILAGLFKASVLSLLMSHLTVAQAIELDIPAQRLDKALNALAHQTGERIIFSTDLTEKKSVPALKGNYSTRDALEKLLSSTGLALSPISDKGFTVIQATEHSTQVLSELVVKEQAEGNGLLSLYKVDQASNGALGNTALQDTPFSVTVVNAADLADRQVTNIADAFKLDAAVTASSNPIARENSMITVRGLPLDSLNGYKINGLNISPWSADLPIEHFEQIELLKGLSGFMYGFSQPGGILNFTLKRAGNTPVSTVTTSMGTSSQYAVAIDLGRRIADDKLGIRINYVNEGGDTYLHTPIKRNSASLALDAKLTDQLTLEADTLYQKRKVNGSMFALQVDNGATTPRAIDGKTRLTQDFTYHQTEILTSSAGLRWAFNDNWNLSTSVRTAKLKRINEDSYLYIADDAGNYSDTLVQWYSEHRNQSANLMLNGSFETGQIKHALVMGTDLQTVQRSIANTDYFDLGVGNLYSGRNRATNPHADLDTNIDTLWKTRNVGIFVSDTIQWTPQWSTIIGLRHSDYRKTQPSGPTYAKSKITPTYALMWKPLNSLTAYLSYVEALEEGNTAPIGTNNENTTFGPLESKQYEIGLKQQGSFWSAEAALFRMQRGLAYTNSSNVYVQQDKGLVLNGLDLAGRVEIGKHLALRSSVLFMQSENQSDDNSVDGKDAANAPKFSAALQGDYRVPSLTGVTLSAGARYVGNRYIEAGNTHQLDHYTLLDIAARYVTTLNQHPITLRAALNNLTNEKYWQNHGDWNFLTPGEPRTFKVSAQVDF